MATITLDLQNELAGSSIGKNEGNSYYYYKFKICDLLEGATNLASKIVIERYWGDGCFSVRECVEYTTVVILKTVVTTGA